MILYDCQKYTSDEIDSVDVIKQGFVSVYNNRLIMNITIKYRFLYIYLTYKFEKPHVMITKLRK